MYIALLFSSVIPHIVYLLVVITLIITIIITSHAHFFSVFVTSSVHTLLCSHAVSFAAPKASNPGCSSNCIFLELIGIG